jgi:hypothetical protein
MPYHKHTAHNAVKSDGSPVHSSSEYEKNRHDPKTGKLYSPKEQEAHNKKTMPKTQKEFDEMEGNK